MSVILGGKNLGTWGIVTGFDLGEPEVVIIKQKVPGRNGELDQTEALTGYPTFGNRTISINMSIITHDKEEFRATMSEIRNCFHGKVKQAIFPDDEDFFYEGRCNIKESRVNAARGDILIEMDAFPYKRKTADTVITQVVSGNAEITCPNLSEPVVPKIQATAPMSVTFGGKTVTFNTEGTYIPDFVFEEGDNVLSVSGTGTITITYREGAL